MYIPFDEISDQARVWVYQSDRAFSQEEVSDIKDKIKAFLNDWNAHGTALKSSAKVFHDHFLVVAVDETQHGASGCSIDAKVRFVQQLGNHLGVNFFDRTQVAFKDGETIVLRPMTALKGVLSPEDISFNNLVKNKAELINSWEVPVVDSWLKRYL
jgi:hypothetical protein